MLKIPHFQRPPDSPARKLSKLCAAPSSLLFLGVFLIQIAHAHPVHILNGVKAVESIHGVLGLEDEPKDAQALLYHSKKLVRDYRIPSELNSSYEKRRLKQPIAENADLIKPVSSEAKKLDDFAFSSLNYSRLSGKERNGKNWRGLLGQSSRFQVDPHKKDLDLSIKDEYLDVFFQLNRLLELEQNKLKTAAYTKVASLENFLSFQADFKALVAEALKKTPRKQAVKLLRWLMKPPKDIPGNWARKWHEFIGEIEKGYKRLEVTCASLILEFFQKIFQPNKWREERMLRDFHKIRRANLKHKMGPKEQLILKLEEVRNYGIDFSPQDQNLIHKIAVKGDKVKLDVSDLKQLEKLGHLVTQILDQLLKVELKAAESDSRYLAHRAHTMLKANQKNQLSQAEQDLLTKLDACSTRRESIPRRAPDALKLTDVEIEIVRVYAKEYSNLLSELRRYSGPRALQIDEIDLHPRFADAQTRAREVLECLVQKGVATRTQERLLSQLKAQSFVGPRLEPEKVASLAHAFWIRQVNLPPEKKAHWVADSITPELCDEFSIRASSLERLKNPPPSNEKGKVDLLVIEHLAKIHDELVASMSEQEKALQELAALRKASRQDNVEVEDGFKQKTTHQIDSMKGFLDMMIKERFRQVSYARLHWNPTQEARALERLTILKDKKMPLSIQQTQILQKLQKEEPLSDFQRTVIKPLAIDSVLWQDSKFPTELEVRALKLCYYPSLNDLTDYDFGLLHNLKEAEMRELSPIASLPSTNERFRKISKFSQISQILKRAAERRSLKMRLSQAYLLCSIGKTEIGIMKSKVAEADRSQKYLQHTFDRIMGWVKFFEDSRFE